ncbi:chemotaxis protein CheC [Herbaspirillum huttiense]|uniref:Chemotaxis protein CheC n=1 Tax=Herbaspirillum huttiense subsp. lycopersici TaxID=3074428 RepID=A0ABU2EGH8_9BURK|nr:MULTISPECIES: chemotaxis protein CheC [Herbaspirillum]MBP1312877.1 chemotaxis protein CheC [Herbaspirillum sp. 1130]MAF01559.1 chemotaxis protein CheC [Herbaspirillum sp.]MBN9356129.1 chemotaxis protein CheC [Herbaspirillum huttiense]MBO18422.1 chemotaxis protein CheC [Herbaspirillum sp.]MCP3654977.1 chemotaxis protein CheC [Herbaspirillum sp.]
MSILNEIERDALTEIFNVGAGRAAQSLSEIVGDEVRLSVPSVEVLRSGAIDEQVLPRTRGRFATVSQNFDGPFDAEAVLLFTEDRALSIVRDMMGSQMSLDELAEFEREAMCELGNIILNACLSAMADMLEITLNSSLPQYLVSSPDDISARLASAQGDESYVLVLHIDLVIEKHQTDGHLIFLLSSSSLHALVEHVQRYLGKIGLA